MKIGYFYNLGIPMLLVDHSEYEVLIDISMVKETT